MPQKTLKAPVVLEGVGVHSGERSTIFLYPAPENSGIVFKNRKFPDQLLNIGTVIPVSAMHATVLQYRGGTTSRRGLNPTARVSPVAWTISTIEHLMAALHALGIDNVLVEFESTSPRHESEFPILDGSALPFAQAILDKGIKQQAAKKRYITPKKVLRFEDDTDRFIEITPAQITSSPDNLTLNFNYSVSFDHPLVQGSTLSGVLTEDFFIEELAPARTFGFLEQLPLLRKHGLAKGTTLGNTVVVGDNIFLNSLRFKDEFIRHKLLDLIGDLALLGHPLVGTVTAHKTGHSFNRLVIEHFVMHPEEWEIF